MQLAEENPNEIRHAATIEQLRIHRPYVIGKRVLPIVGPIASRHAMRVDTMRVDTATGGNRHQRGADLIEGSSTLSDR